MCKCAAWPSRAWGTPPINIYRWSLDSRPPSARIWVLIARGCRGASSGRRGSGGLPQRSGEGAAAQWGQLNNSPCRGAARRAEKLPSLLCHQCRWLSFVVFATGGSRRTERG
eukprot:8698051-Pyramimonas_sp.AAC.1